MAGTPQGEYDGRVARARTLMRDNGIDCLIVTDPVTYQYFTGHRAPGHAGRPSVFVLPLDGDPAVITMWVQKMFHELDGVPFPTWVEDRRFYTEFPFDSTRPTDWGIADVCRERGVADGTLAIELGEWTKLGIPVADYERLKEDLAGARFVDGGRVTWGCRLVKSQWELEQMRDACALSGRAWEQVLPTLRIGETARDISKKIALAYDEVGGAMMFGGFARGATGERGAFQAGDVLYLDGGGTFGGYPTDFTRRAVFGEPSQRQLDEHRIALEIQQAMLDAMKPGTRVAEIFAIGIRAIEEAGLRNYSDDPAKRVGHGIGLEQGEPPSISGTDETVLVEGMTLTVEPKFYSDDGLVNPDEMVAVTANGYEILSTVPSRDLHVVG